MLAEIQKPPIAMVFDAPLPTVVPAVIPDCYLRRIVDLAPSTGQPLLAVLNGDYLLRRDWGRRLLPGDELAFVRLPQGDGGGDSDPFRTVLQIVVLVVSIYAGQFQNIGPILAAGVAVAGNALVNAIAPLPQPGASQRERAIQSSPTYQASISLAGNQARLGQPIPVLYGRHIILPDFWQRPYYRYNNANNEQDYYAVFVVGEGEYDLESLTIDDTPFGSFPAVPQFDFFLGQDGTSLVTKAPVPVTEVSGIDIETTSATQWYVVSPAEQEVDELQVDVVFPRGVYFADDTGDLDPITISFKFEYQEVDDDGNGVGSVFSSPVYQVTDNTNSPIRRSYSVSVPAGRYQIRFQRVTGRVENNRRAEDLVWAGAWGFLTPTPDFLDDVTYLAVKMQSSNALNQQSAQRIRAIVQRKLPVYRNGVWSDPEPTRSPVWAALDAARNTTYGAGLPDSRIDLGAFLNVWTTLESRRDRFDGIFDTRTPLFTALQQILRAGRALVIPYLSQLTVVRDELRELPAALFSPRNIRPNTFNLEFKVATSETADGVTAVYFDEKTWAEKRITVGAPGVGTPANPAEVQMFGMVQPIQVQREALFIAHENYYRRRIATFETELDAAAARYGDLVLVRHDLASWGHGGEVTSYVPVSGLLGISEPMPEEWDDGRQLYAVYPDTRGKPCDPVPVRYLTPTTLSGAHNLSPSPIRPDNMERAQIAVYDASEIIMPSLVTDISPRARDRYSVTVVVEDDRVHDADAGLDVPEDEVVGAPVVDDVIFVSSDAVNLNLRDLYNSELGDPGSSPVSVEFRVQPGVVVRSASAGTPALVSGDFPAGSTVVLRNLGRVAGAGGAGGASGLGGAFGNGLPGGFGGTSVLTTVPLTIINGAGSLWGGGGGGGGGAGDSYEQGGETFFVAGGAGGGGAGDSAGDGGDGRFSGAADGDPGTQTSPGVGADGDTGTNGTGGRGGNGGAPGFPGQGGFPAGGATGAPGGSAGESIEGIANVTFVGSQGDIRGPQT